MVDKWGLDQFPIESGWWAGQISVLTHYVFRKGDDGLSLKECLDECKEKKALAEWEVDQEETGLINNQEVEVWWADRKEWRPSPAEPW